MDNIAPTKADKIMIADLDATPLLNKKIITRDTTSFAPEEIPRTKGLAIGFPKNVCKRKPETDRIDLQMIRHSRCF